MQRLILVTTALAMVMGAAIFVFYRLATTAPENAARVQSSTPEGTADAIGEADRTLVAYEPGPAIWDEANAKVRRLSPGAFPELPAGIRVELVKRQCTVPQTFLSTQPHNVIHGEFYRKGQKDWAVLCSTGQVSSILVFWGGSEKNMFVFPATPDKNYLQGRGEGKIGYSCEISAVGKDYILEHHKRYGGPTPPPIAHDGINVAFIEKASSVLYREKGEWLSLTGAD